MDAAIDEGDRLIEDPMMPDEDPEGGIHNEALLHDDRVHENRVHDDDMIHHDDRLQGFGGGKSHVKNGNNVFPDFVDDGGNVVAPPAADDSGRDTLHKNEQVILLKDDNVIDGEGIGSMDNPLNNNNNNDINNAVNHNIINEDEGGEVETGDKVELQQPEEDIVDNRAKENFFGDDPPLRLRMHHAVNDDSVIASNRRDNSFDDNMVLGDKNNNY